MMNEDRNYDVVMKISNFFGSRIMDVENEDGYMEQCLVIPLDRNGLKVSPSKNIYANFYMTKTMNGCIKGWTHYLMMRVRKDVYRKIKSLGYSIPYMGNAKPSAWNVNLAEINKKQTKVKNILD